MPGRLLYALDCPARHRDIADPVSRCGMPNDDELCGEQKEIDSECLGCLDGKDRDCALRVLALEIKTARWPSKDPLEIRRLILKMSLANPLCGAPRIHGELLKLGNVGQATVAKYMARCSPMLLPVCRQHLLGFVLRSPSKSAMVTTVTALLGS
jgi:hypothetical protein